ncbi:pre-RNA processing PIH1/Nop17-domain-containing protein [Limtongia smithiae]|uniref:pre-RNA processing PIH1/Nop17-domain-containing protein n=1 Tax=Limtongia smithiae TaxID=1125753 RepID=UPI0034CFBF8A
MATATTLELAPQPGFVAKTLTLGTGAKLFINFCHDRHVPDDISADEISAASVYLSPQRADKDAVGQSCTVYDCCFHTNFLRRMMTDKVLRDEVVLRCIAIIESAMSVPLSREYKTPKLRWKGHSHETTVTFTESGTEAPACDGILSSIEDAAREIMLSMDGNSGRVKGVESEAVSVTMSPLSSRKLIEEIDDTPSVPTVATIDLHRAEFPKFHILVTNDDKAALQDAILSLNAAAKALVLSSPSLSTPLEIAVPAGATPDKAEAYYAADTRAVSIFI